MCEGGDLRGLGLVQEKADKVAGSKWREGGSGGGGGENVDGEC